MTMMMRRRGSRPGARCARIARISGHTLIPACFVQVVAADGSKYYWNQSTDTVQWENPDASGKIEKHPVAFPFAPSTNEAERLRQVEDIAHANRRVAVGQG